MATYASLPARDAAEYSTESPVPQNAKRLQGGRHRNTTDYYGEGPGGPYDNSTGVFTESSWTNASDGQPSDDERTGLLMMEFRDIERPLPPTSHNHQNTSKSRRPTDRYMSL